MEKTFDKVIKFVLAQEGGYVNDPFDPGGETKYGISKKAYPFEDIKNMTEERASQIYYEDYWEKAGCESLEWPLDAVVFDTAVNLGVSRAKVLLKYSKTWIDYLFLRLKHYTELPLWSRFGKGWIRRVINLYRWVMAEEAIIKNKEGG